MQTFLLGAAELILVFSVQFPVFAQANEGVTHGQRAAVLIPFVGCASSGQVEALKAPEGTSKAVPLRPKDAQKLAYYESSDGIGLIAPRGWYCMGLSGSGGAALYLSPEPIGQSLSGVVFDGPAIELGHISGENSGRYEVAETVGRIFPSYRAFARRVWKDLDSPLPTRPYLKDILTYKSESLVEYTTPAKTDGLGTRFSRLTKNGASIAGAAILVGNPPDLVLLSVRLPEDLVQLTPVIVTYVEHDAAKAR